MTAQHDMASPHRLVLASAGSGKTFALTNAYLSRLLDGEAPSSLLATTFTKVAAGEVLERVLARLSGAVLDRDALAELRAHTRDDLTEVECERALERIMASLHRLFVQTIDSYISGVLRAYSFDLGLVPGWAMLSEDEDLHVRTRAADRTLRAYEPGELCSVLVSLHADGLRAQAHSAIEHLATRGYNAWLTARGRAEPWRAIPPAGRALTQDQLRDATRALAEFKAPENKNKDRTPDSRWVSALRQLSQHIESADWDEVVSQGLVKAVLDDKDAFSRKPIPDEFRELLKPIVAHAAYQLTSRHAKRNLAAYELLKNYDHHYRAIKDELGAMTYDDPPRLLLAAIDRLDLDHLYYRLDAAVRHLYLDEYQDTSLTQFQLLEPLLDELLSQSRDGRSVFCVGDIKQSLYGWRGAESELLPAMATRWPSFVPSSLDTSWRSSPIVLDAVNAVFSSLNGNLACHGSEAIRAAADAWQHSFTPHTAAHATMPGTVRLRTPSEDADNSADDDEHAVLIQAARSVQGILQAAPGASVGVLVRSGKHIPVLLSLLRRLGVDASERRGNPLTDTPAAAAVISALTVIQHSQDSAALAHVRSTPLARELDLHAGAEDEFRETVTRWRQEIAERGLSAVLENWAERASPHTDARGMVRLSQLIALADVHSGGTLEEFLRVARTRKIDESQDARVRVMTVHASKGLEFDAVVLPLLGSSTWRVQHDEFIVGRDGVFGDVRAISLYASQLLQRLWPEMKELCDVQLRRTATEQLCGLYVAMTRARHQLEMIVPVDSAGREKDATPKTWSARPAHVIRQALAPECPASPAQTLFESTSPDPWAPSRAGSSADAPELPDVELRVQSESATVDPPPVQTVFAEELISPPAATALERGELVHACFEQIEWLDDGAPDPATWRRIAAGAGCSNELADEAGTIMRRATESPSVAALFHQQATLERSEGADRVCAHRETPFDLPADAGIPAGRGRVDRLHVFESDGAPVAAEIIDFKTDRLPEQDPATLGAAAERHRAQLERYASAVARMLGLPVERVACWVVLTDAAEAVALDRRSAD